VFRRLRSHSALSAEHHTPNIIVIYADDMGYDDVQTDINNGRSNAGASQPNDIPDDKIQLLKGNVAK